MQRLRLFFNKHHILRFSLALLLAVLVFGGVMEWRMRAFTASTVYGGNTDYFFLRPHPTALWCLRPHMDCDVKTAQGKFHLTTTSWGTRGEEIPLRKEVGQWRALIVGDSITFGWGLDDSASLGDRLHNLISELHRDMKIQIVNASCPGWTSLQGREFCSDLVNKLQPNLLVICFCNNDAAYAEMSDSQRAGEQILWPWLSRILYRSDFFLFLNKKLVATQYPGALPASGAVYGAARVSGDEYQANLEWFATAAKEVGAQIVYLNPPKRGDDPNKEMEFYRSLNKSVAEKTGGLWVDLDSMFSSRHQNQKLFLDSVHPSGEGCQIMADAVCTEIEQKGWVR